MVSVAKSIFCVISSFKSYCKRATPNLFNASELKFEKLIRTEKQLCVREEQELYKVHPAKKKLEETGQPNAAPDSNSATRHCRR